MDANYQHRHTSMASYAKNDSKDLLYYYSLLLNNWHWVAMGLFAGILAFYLHLRYSKTTYNVAGSILVEDTEQNSVSREAILELGGLAKEAPLMEDRVRILGSTELMSRIVDSLNLNVTYSQEGDVKTTEMYEDLPLELLYWNTEGAEKQFQLKVKHYDATRFLLYRTEENTEMKNYGVPFSYGRRELVLKKKGLITDHQPTIINVYDEYTMAGLYASKLNIVPAGRSNIINVSIVFADI